MEEEFAIDYKYGVRRIVGAMGRLAQLQHLLLG